MSKTFSDDLKLEVSEYKNDPFIIKAARSWMDEAAAMPAPKPLFDIFWFENELCMLFADTNVGKSILAVQIANSLATGVAIGKLTPPTRKHKVVLLDCELSEKQFQARYSIDYRNNHVFDYNFARMQLNPDFVVSKGLKYEEFIEYSLELTLQIHKPSVLIIDNITALRSETEKASDAIPLMNMLKSLKQRHNLSVLVLAHTPKRAPNKPITRNDLQGSKMIINFADSAFAIGESHTEAPLRYLKQIKARNTEIVYGEDNVLLCEIEKPHNFLQFNIKEGAEEYQHLKEPDRSNNGGTQEKLSQAVHLHMEGMSNVKIGEQLNCSESYVRKLLKKAEAKGMLG